MFLIYNLILSPDFLYILAEFFRITLRLTKHIGYGTTCKLGNHSSEDSVCNLMLSNFKVSVRNENGSLFPRNI